MEERNRPDVIVIEIWKKNALFDNFYGEVVIPLYHVPERNSKHELSESVCHIMSFYQPRDISDLWEIMDSRKQISTTFRKFLRWRLDCFISRDIESMQRGKANHQIQGNTEHVATEQSGSRESFLGELFVNNSQCRGMFECAANAVPKLKPVFKVMEDRRMLVELDYFEIRQNITPPCRRQRHPSQEDEE